MKKKIFSAVNVNFIIILPIVVFILLFAYNCSQQFNFVHSFSELNQTKDLIEEQNKIYEGYGLAEFVLVLTQFIYIVLPIINALILFIFSGIARLVYGTSQKRIIAYRILMGIIYFGLIMLGIELPFFCSNRLFLIIFFEIILLIILFVCIRNTKHITEIVRGESE